MKWSPAIAGKRGRCKCGATLQVPASIAPPAQAEQEEDLLSALEVPIKPIVEPTSYANEPRYAAASTAAPATLPHPRPALVPAPDAGGGAISDKAKEQIKEIYVPMGLLILGYVAILVWLGHHGALMFTAVMGAIVVATLLMFGKTVVLGLWAWSLARKSGSFGHPVGTILKIAGLIVALDAASVWAIEWMVWMNIIDHRGHIYIRDIKYLLFMLLAVTFVVALIVSYGAFGLRDEEAGFFSRFMAGGNLAINVVLLILVASIASSAAQQARSGAALSNQIDAVVDVPGTPGTSSASAGAAVPKAPRRVRVVITPADREIDDYMLTNAPYVVPPKEWPKAPVYKPEDAPVRPFLDALLAAGSPQVRVDTLVRRGGLIRIIVELPTDPDRRDACCGLATNFRAANPQTMLEPEPPTFSRFMVIDVPAGPSLQAVPATQPATQPARDPATTRPFAN